MKRVGVASWSLCAVLLVAGVPARAADSAVIIQESNGFPGGEKATDLSRQKVTIRGERLRVLDPSHMWALFISVPARTVQEAAADLAQYEERPFSYYEQYREDRRENLEAQAEEYLRRRERTDEPKALRQLRDEYRRIGGDPDQPGRLVARLQHYPQDQRTATILVDREPREVTLEHYVIRENQKDQPAFDLWVTEDVELPVDLLAFYRQLGPFGRELNARLAEVPGTLVECEAVLDTGTFHRTFRSRVVEVRTEGEVPPEAVTVPDAWEEVEPEEREEQGGGSADTVVNALTGEPVPRDEALSFRSPRTGRRYYVATSEERARLVRMLAGGETPPHGGRGGR